jgi:dTDP-3-amino-2,3,6-trideoxy-4-keto-D-glucose/dTDP-3-amino-3,4,6-trideoxy-alpha-D-glucose/dTDP-2,6-dideoxy-D-kanosamine transaminase
MLAINDLQRHEASLQEEMARAALEVLASGWYALGRRVEAFEHAFAGYCGVAHAVGVGSGTDALELALLALGVGPGDEVVTVANAGMYATVAIVSVGASPRFADVDPATMTLDPATLEPLLGPRCKAIVLTHLYGRMADVDRLVPVAEKAGIPLIEDCAQAHGAAHGGRLAGSFGAIGCFSFYPTKNLGACGDAGLVTTSDGELAAKLRRLRQYGWAEKYRAVEPRGRNTRLDELQAAILLAKLPHLPAWNARRNEIARRYSADIQHPLITVPGIDSGHVAHLYVVRAADRNALRQHLRDQGVGAEVHYPVPDHRQAAYAERFRDVHLPVAERLCAEVLTLPCFPEMTDAEVERVITACTAWRA